MKTNLNRRNILRALGIIAAAAAMFAIGWLARSRLPGEPLRLIEAAQQLVVEDSYYNQKPPDEIAYAAVRGMLDAVDDPYAELIEPQAAQGLLDTFAGKSGVVGLYADNQDGEVTVEIVFPESAAEEAGVRPGDVIVAIDGYPLDPDSDSSEAGLLMRGAPGTPVHLEVLREGLSLEFDVTRRERQFVISRMLPEGIAYLHLNAFNVTAAEAMKVQLEDLLKQNPSGLVWDLRDNEGGDMQAAARIIGYFIDEGPLFSVELTRGRRVEFNASGDAIAAQLPMVVLMDETTYSAAETAAAAIAETGRGRTVGSTSYGKGLIQATVPLPGDALLQMTIARWISAGGEWYHQRGVPAQIEALDDPDTQADELLEKAVEVLLASP